jgi:hypothetical protein
VIGGERIEVRGQVREFEVLWCRVTFTASADRIASTRAAWTRWRRALEWLAMMLTMQRRFDRLTVAPGLPKAEPWNE